MKLEFIIGGALFVGAVPPFPLDPVPELFQWCASWYTSACERSAGVARGRLAANTALGTLGTPYSWGGGGPSGATYGTGRGKHVKGFDCAGLTEYAWSQAGVGIGSSTYEQWRSGTRIPRTRIQVGDLAFFETDSKRPGPDHVGVAIKANQMVVAPFTGAVVRIEAIDRRNFVGLVRPARQKPG
ncbi:NlpC/P60 family protein [Nonomuraea sp. NPDC055795]